MSDWLLRILGIDPGRIPSDAETELIWTHAPESWGVFVLVAALGLVLAGIIWAYRHELPSCPRPLRFSLATLRAIVMVVLFVVLLGPALSFTQKRVIEPVVVMLLDRSQSMGIEDQYRGDAAVERVAGVMNEPAARVRSVRQSRAAILNRLVQRNSGALLG